MFNKYSDSDTFQSGLIISLALFHLIFIPSYKADTISIPANRMEVGRSSRMCLSPRVIGFLQVSNSRLQVPTQCCSVASITWSVVPLHGLHVPKVPGSQGGSENGPLSVCMETSVCASYKCLPLLFINSITHGFKIVFLKMIL